MRGVCRPHDAQTARIVDVNAVDARHQIPRGTRAARIGVAMVNYERLAAVGRFDYRVVPGRRDARVEIGGHQRVVLRFGPRAERRRGCRHSHAVIFVSRVVGRIGHIICVAVFEDERPLVAAVHVAAHQLPRLRGLRDEDRFAVETRQILFEPRGVYLAESVTVAVAVAGVVQIGSFALVVIDEDMAVDGRVFGREPRRVQVAERPVGGVARREAREQNAARGVGATVGHVETAAVILHLGGPEAVGAEVVGGASVERAAETPRHKIGRGVVIEAVVARGACKVVDALVLVHERIGYAERVALRRRERVGICVVRAAASRRGEYRREQEGR